MRAHRTVDLALVSVAVVWGSSYLVTKDVVAPDGVFAFLAIRFAIAATGLALLAGPRLRRVDRREVLSGMLVGAILSVVFTLETAAVMTTSAARAGLLISLTIVMTPLLDQWVRGTRLPPVFYGAAVLAVAGVGLLTCSGGLSATNRGDLLIVLAAGARAVHVTVIARLSQSHPPDTMRVTLVQLCTCLVVFAILSGVAGRGMFAVATQMTCRAWLFTGYLALVCTVFAFVVQTWAVRRTSPARVSLLLGTEPLWATAGAVLLAAEPLTVTGVCGAALIVLGTNWGAVVDTRRRDSSADQSQWLRRKLKYRNAQTAAISPSTAG